LAHDRHAAPLPLGLQVGVTAALVALIAAKMANVGVPLVMKGIVDRLDATTAILAVPLALLVAYGALRLSTTFFTELREFLFCQGDAARGAHDRARVFRHLHALSLRFHLARQTAGSPATWSAASAASRR